MTPEEIRVRCLELASGILAEARRQDSRYRNTDTQTMALDTTVLADSFVSWVGQKPPAVSGTGQQVRPNASSSEKEPARPSARV